jgi:AraC-like DNA-binding protein
MEQEADMINAAYTGRLLENLVVQVTYAQLKNNYIDWKRTDETPSFNRLYFIAGGEGKVILNGITYSPKPNQLMIMPARTTQTTDTSPDNPYLRYICHFDARIGEWPLFQSANKLYIADVSDPGRVSRIFDQLIDQFQTGGPFAPLYTQSALLLLIAYCLEEGGYTDFMKDFMQKTERDKLAQVLSYIDDHLNEQLEVEQLAELMHLHPNYFIPYFKKFMAVTPMHYVQRKRMEEAKRLLSFTDTSISDIADHIGMGLAYFSRQFKQITGISPTAYRAHTR